MSFFDKYKREKIRALVQWWFREQLSQLTKSLLNNQNHPYRAKIPAITKGTPRPLWSVMIPTYNCAGYLRETLTAVLDQDPGTAQMQIEVIDDCSTKDDPQAVVEELGQGRVKFYRQPQNVGYIRNFETCLLRSQGHLVHLLHGDDYVRSGFYQKLQQGFEKHPEIGAAYCRYLLVDEQGHWQKIAQLEQSDSGILHHALENFVTRHPVQTPSIVVRREIYEQLGGFDRRFSCSGEDWEMWVRIACNYPIWYEVEPLAAYRTHSNSLSGVAVRQGRDLQDLKQGLTLIETYLSEKLPKKSLKPLLKKSREFWAFCGLHNALEMIKHSDWSGAFAQVQEIVRINHSFKILSISTFYLTLAIVKFLAGEYQEQKLLDFLPKTENKPNLTTISEEQF